MSVFLDKYLHKAGLLHIEESFKKISNQTTYFKDFKIDFEIDKWGMIQITAYDPKGEYAGEIQLTDDATGFEGEAYVMLVQIEKKYQRQGLASFMYDWAEKLLGQKIVGSVDQSKDAKAFWRNRIKNH